MRVHARVRVCVHAAQRRALRDYFRPHLANNERHAHFAGSVAMYEKRKKLIQLLSLFDLPVMTVVSMSIQICSASCYLVDPFPNYLTVLNTFILVQ